jgi:hypothetical protein
MENFELIGRTVLSSDTKSGISSTLQGYEDNFRLKLSYLRRTSFVKPKVSVVLYNASRESHKIHQLILNFKTENYGNDVMNCFDNGNRVIPMKHSFLFKLCLSCLQFFSNSAIAEPVALMKLENDEDIAVAVVNGLYPTIFGFIFGIVNVVFAVYVERILWLWIPLIIFGLKVLCDVYILHYLLLECPLNALFPIDSTVIYQLTKLRSEEKTNILDNIVFQV